MYISYCGDLWNLGYYVGDQIGRLNRKIKGWIELIETDITLLYIVLE